MQKSLLSQGHCSHCGRRIVFIQLLGPCGLTVFPKCLREFYQLERKMTSWLKYELKKKIHSVENGTGDVSRLALTPFLLPRLKCYDYYVICCSCDLRIYPVPLQSTTALKLGHPCGGTRLAHTCPGSSGNANNNDWAKSYTSLLFKTPWALHKLCFQLCKQNVEQCLSLFPHLPGLSQTETLVLEAPGHLKVRRFSSLNLKHSFILHSSAFSVMIEKYILF